MSTNSMMCRKATVLHRDTSWIFTWVFDPISRALNDLVQWNLNVLHFLTWVGVLAVVVVVPPNRDSSSIAVEAFVRV